MTNELKLQSAIKRKVVLRENLHGTTGHKVKTCKVSRIDNYWYGFEIDGYYFECKWEKYYKSPATFYFRNNKLLENAGYCYQYGIPVDKVKYASSLYFGCGTDLIPVLWVIGEVLDNKMFYEYHKNIG
jgi:hypothetical protein